MLKRAEGQGELKGLAVRKYSTSISHIFFADDSVMFCKALKEGCHKVKIVLNLYEKGSGQMINNHKSLIFFSYSIPRDAQLALY